MVRFLIGLSFLALYITLSVFILFFCACNAFKANCAECGYAPRQILPHGSHLKKISESECLARVAESINTFAEFDHIVGFDYLCGMHLNGSKVELGSRVDRHNSLEQGALGMTVFEYIMADSRFDGIPMVHETIDESIWPKEIALLKKLAGEPIAA